MPRMQKIKTTVREDDPPPRPPQPLSLRLKIDQRKDFSHTLAS